MRDADFQTFANELLSQYLRKEISQLTFQQLTGGCINQAFKISSSEGTFFLKHNQPDFEVQFNKEAAALNLLRATNTLKVPEVLQVGTYKGRAYLLTEYIPPGITSSDFWQSFGESLALLHRTTSNNGQFGLSFDNYIGELPQKNCFGINWTDFFIENRLQVQLSLALTNNLISQEFAKRFRKLYIRLPEILTDEPPSLIHGDLWSGNFLCGTDGQAVLIDPATYFGNREIELAFTQMFGGFAPEFYESYQQAWPLRPGFEERFEIYNLYPLLVHVNLFGTSYLSGVERVIRKYT